MKQKTALRWAAAGVLGRGLPRGGHPGSAPPCGAERHGDGSRGTAGGCSSRCGRHPVLFLFR